MVEYEAAHKDIKPFLGKIEKIVQQDGLGVEIYGSFATRLWLKQSNIDIQITRKDYYDNSISPK